MGIDHLEIKVYDTGIGIKNEDKDKLFQLFGKLPDQQNINREGTGLGLHITKQLVE